jgi:O-succinylbenzoic acid--CoA ligase
MSKSNSIILNGKQFSPEKIRARNAEITTNSSVPDWEKELYLFLNEWFSESDFVLAQTSGSTGEPKPIELPKSVMQKSAERTIEYFGLQKNDRLLLSLPCRYIAGKMMVVRAIVGQMNLIAVDPATGFEFLEHENFDFGAMVPNQVFKLMEQPSGIEKLQNINNLLIGGSTISEELEAQIARLSSRVVITYGMTETASHIAIRELSGNRESDFYQCLPGISVSLSENDCLQIHLPEFSESLQTNDLAELQSNTSFRILGRSDSVIISGGIKYSPEALEKKLEQVINDRFVISSVPDEKLGEKLALVIEGKPHDKFILEQKIDALLTAFERPKVIYFLEHFPTTVSGKIRRKDLKDLIENYR